MVPSRGEPSTELETTDGGAVLVWVLGCSHSAPQLCTSYGSANTEEAAH